MQLSILSGPDNKRNSADETPEKHQHIWVILEKERVEGDWIYEVVTCRYPIARNKYCGKTEKRRLRPRTRR